MAHGEIQHIEFPADDLDRATRFYHELFGWEFSPMPGSEGYLLFRTGVPGATSLGTGGAIGQRGSAVNAETTVYVTVDSIDDVLAKVPGLGGSIDTGKTQIPGFGWYAIIHDSEGSILGLYEVSPAES
jgi:predicted enzyme related to lactoylglutathione lyase